MRSVFFHRLFRFFLSHGRFSFSLMDSLDEWT